MSSQKTISSKEIIDASELNGVYSGIQSLEDSAEAISRLIDLRNEKFTDFISAFGEDGQRYSVDHTTFVSFISGLSPKEASRTSRIQQTILESGARLSSEDVGKPVFVKRYGFLSDLGLIATFQETGLPVRYIVSNTTEDDNKIMRTGEVEIAIKGLMTTKSEKEHGYKTRIPKISSRPRPVSTYVKTTREFEHNPEGHGGCSHYGDPRLYVGVNEVMSFDRVRQLLFDKTELDSYVLLTAAGIEYPESRN